MNNNKRGKFLKQLCLPDKITYLINVDSIIYQDNMYIITLGQEDTKTLKTIFTVNDLFNL